MTNNKNNSMDFRISDNNNDQKIKLPLTEKEFLREKLKAKVDILTETASVVNQMQKEPIKMLGSASAVGAIIGIAIGASIRRSKKIYVDANSPIKYQKRLIKAQSKSNSAILGSSFMTTAVTLGAKALTNPIVQEKLEEVAQNLIQKIENKKNNKNTETNPTSLKVVQLVQKTESRPSDKFLKNPKNK